MTPSIPRCIASDSSTTTTASTRSSPASTRSVGSISPRRRSCAARPAGSCSIAWSPPRPCGRPGSCFRSTRGRGCP
ncbi:MAG: hypothetical protein ACK55Z_33320 [bacterium]